ncbi:MAG TPA: winged helix-turn-helix domain-containing protein [Streptosporangiaceae bacterium]
MPSGDPNPGDQLAGVIAALDHPTRRRIVATLLVRGTHVSQLARDLGVSRPVLHVHLARLQEAGLVTSSLRFSDDGKALRHFELQPFDIRLTPEVIAESVDSPAVRPSPEKGRV